MTDDPCQGHDYQGGAGFDVAGFGRYDLPLLGQNNGVKATLGGTAVDPARGACTPTQVRSDNEILEGSAGPDILTGTNGNNPLILGREGNDVIRGGGGSDGLQGDEGSDSLYGEAGNDDLDAQDGQSDQVIDCGKGGGTALRDGADPRARRVRQGEGQEEGRSGKKK